MAQAKGESQRTLLIGGMVLLALIIIVAAVFLYASLTSKPPQGPLSAEEIARRYSEAVVFIEAGWKLIDTGSGRQLYHAHFLNEEAESNASTGADGPGGAGEAAPKRVKVFEGLGQKIPLYMQVGGKVQPLLIGTDGGGLHNPIGGQSAGSGFVVRSDGFILTNRHLASAWETAYVWPAETGPGLLIDETGKKEGKRLAFEDLPRDWVPGTSTALAESVRYEKRQKRLVPKLLKSRAVLEGRFDYLDVLFARTKLRTRARLVRSSDRHDVALIKVDLPQALKTVEINPNYGGIGQGAKAVVLAYPAAALEPGGLRQPRDLTAPGAQARVLPDPAVDEGHVVTIHKGGQPIRGVDYAVEFGDSFELSFRSMGGGSSGGPVFDDRGRVFALLYATRTAREAPASFAVPISYAAEIMNLGRVTQ